MSRAGFGLSILGRRVVLACGPEITEEKDLGEGSPIGGPDCDAVSSELYHLASGNSCIPVYIQVFNNVHCEEGSISQASKSAASAVDVWETSLF